ncbi:TetR/AcrR family transcriptional regulator [Streptomyces sp. RerS4]|uniref:TetR/AcrR family transcriptional regulator n=1 Tax=Streptomyces sp. RerS4 TaxID=2942449 RepID=UPI00201B9A1D|nr:TetR/AcrR family transcriptional regulator [Streptomyces sp. RerS4]UQX02748.1 TetR/AcrR family transcriptional regulator [Streptomyces sp. RerS4]
MPAESSPTRRTRPPRTGGRVRSQEAHDAVLAAAAELLEEVGYQGVTMEGVARRADVAKSTVYRWWKSKPVLVMDAYRATVEARMPTPDTGSLAGDLTEFVAALYRVAAHPLRVKALRGLMAEAQLDPDFAEPFRQWVESRRGALKELLLRAADRGELPPPATHPDTETGTGTPSAPGLDLDLAVDQVFGPFWYRLLVGHAPLDPADAPAHVARLLDGLRGTRQMNESDVLGGRRRSETV